MGERQQSLRMYEYFYSNAALKTTFMALTAPAMQRPHRNFVGPVTEENEEETAGTTPGGKK